MPGLGNAIALGFTKGGGTPVLLSIAYTATQFVFKFKLPSTKSVTINWGDGNSEDVTGQDSTLITKTSNYSGAGTYSFYLTGDVTDLTYIDINNQAFVSGDISGWSVLTNLVTVLVFGTGVSGDISGWSALTSLEDIRAYSTNITGDISGWGTLINLTVLNIGGLTITGDASVLSAATSATIIYVNQTSVTFDNTPAWSNASATMRMQDCAMTSAMVNNMIESFSTCSGCTINVAGTNDHRTAASNDDLNTLLANGNTITLNDVLGAELHTSLNAANDSATEAITAFADYAATIDGGTQVTQGQDISNMLPLGAAQNVSNCVNNNYTSFANGTPTGFDATSNGAATHRAGTADEITLVAGFKYLVKFDLVLNSGTAPNYDFVGSVAGSSRTDEGAQTASSGSNSFIFTLNWAGTGILEFENISTATDFEVTNISVKEIEVLGSDLVTNGAFTANADMNTSNCANGGGAGAYTTFANAAPGGFDATSNGSASHYAGTADEITLVTGQKYVVSFDMVLNSGTAPVFDLKRALGDVSASSDGNQTASAGHNVFEFTASATTTGVFQFLNLSTATDFEITNLSVSDSVTDWVNATGWIVADGIAQCDGSQSGSTNLSQNCLGSVGDIVLIKFTVSNYSAGAVRIALGSTASLIGSTTANGTISAIGVVTGNTVLYINGNAAFIGDVDNISVHKLLVTKEIAASTAYTGTHYVLPEAGSDVDSFIIPVTYAAEAIVAQLITGETNATTGFTSVGLDGTGANVFQSQDTTVDTGVWAIHANSEDTPTASARFYVDLQAAPFSISNGDVVRLEFTARHIGSGATWQAFLAATNNGADSAITPAYSNAATTFDGRYYYWTHDANYRYFIVRESGGGNDGGVFFDNFKVQKVTLT